jgi:hypothetical protein
MAKCPLHCARNNPISWLDDLQPSKLSNGSRGKYGTFWNLEFQAERKEDVIFFPSNARWLLPDRLSSRKDNYIVQIHRINAVATLVIMTM